MLAVELWGCDEGHGVQSVVASGGVGNLENSDGVSVLQDSSILASAQHCVGTAGQA